MHQEQDTSMTVPVVQELNELSKLSEEVNAIIRRTGTNLPREAATGLATLGAMLTRLNQQISTQEDQRNNLLALADIGQVINSSLELDEVLRIVMDTIVRLTGAERGFLMLRDDAGEMQISLARNWEQETLDSSEFAVSSTIVKRVAEEGVAVVTTNAQEDPRFGGQESIVAHNLRSILCVPLKVKDVITGVVYTDNRVRTGLFTESDRDLLAAFANQAAVAIENARLFESVRRTLAEVTELKNLMDNVFASIASGVITADVEQNITLINRAAENILGQEREELLGHGLNAVLSSIAEPIAAHLENVHTRHEAVIGIEIHPTLPQRGEVDLRFNLSPLRDAEDTALGIAIVLDDLTEQKKLEAQRRLFEKMVSPAVIEQLDPEQLALGGKRASITSLFADIRGFTSYSEKLSPEELVSVLNQYLAASADAVLTHEGTIDKFMGDAIMAWFNAPIPQADHALRAVKAAIGIRDSIAALHKKLPKEAHLSFGVGIHYGDAVLGLVGTERRLDYTAIGDSVNTAKRVQENSGPGQILITEDAYKLVKKHIKVDPVEDVQAKGKSQPIHVFEVLSLS